MTPSITALAAVMTASASPATSTPAPSERDILAARIRENIALGSPAPPLPPANDAALTPPARVSYDLSPAMLSREDAIARIKACPNYSVHCDLKTALSDSDADVAMAYAFGRLGKSLKALEYGKDWHDESLAKKYGKSEFNLRNVFKEFAFSVRAAAEAVHTIATFFPEALQDYMAPRIEENMAAVAEADKAFDGFGRRSARRELAAISVAREMAVDSVEIIKEAVDDLACELPRYASDARVALSARLPESYRDNVIYAKPACA